MSITYVCLYICSGGAFGCVRTPRRLALVGDDDVVIMAVFVVGLNAGVTVVLVANTDWLPTDWLITVVVMVVVVVVVVVVLVVVIVMIYGDYDDKYDDAILIHSNTYDYY